MGMTPESASFPPHKVRLELYFSAWVMKTLPSWVQVDLGVNFRLHKVLTRGGAYSGSYNAPHTYMLQYRLATSQYVTYQENNATRIFTSHVGVAWDTKVINELSVPVIGRMFKVTVLTGVPKFPAVQVEFIGCDCEPGPEVAVMRQAGTPYLTAVSQVSDDDSSTCVTVEEYLAVIIFIPVPLVVRDNVTVTAMSKRDPSCPPYDPEELYPMVKLTPPFRSLALSGAFSKCQLWENSEESELNVQVFNCTCSLGVCEGIYIRANPPCSLQLCHVDVN